jgi:predicted amidohydrolase YtcJ
VLTVPTDKIKDITALMTMTGGAVIYQR